MRVMDEVVTPEDRERLRRVQVQPVYAGHAGEREYLADIAVGLRLVPCPRCEAAAGERCLEHVHQAAGVAAAWPAWAEQQQAEAATAAYVAAGYDRGVLRGINSSRLAAEDRRGQLQRDLEEMPLDELRTLVVAAAPEVAEHLAAAHAHDAFRGVI